MCADRTTSVNALCALNAKAPQRWTCDDRRMPKKHPIRLHLMSWRTFLDRTQEWLAAELGVAHSTVLRWEKGTAGVDEATFAAIAQVYGITIAELSAPPADAPKARELDRLMRALPNMDEEGLRALATMAERLAPRR
jgi:transcriptional regulator with XRE-family HTH domain